MNPLRSLALVTLTPVAPLFSAPFLEIGSNAEVFLTARTETRYEDNITLSARDKLDDAVFQFTPGLELLFGKNSLVRGSLVAQENFNVYTDNSDLDSDLVNLLFNVGYAGARLDLGANLAYREINQNTRDTANSKQLVNRKISEGDITGEYALTAKTKLGAALRTSTTKYDSTAYSDQTNHTLPIDYFFAIAPKLDLSAGLQYRKTDLRSFGADSEDFYYNVGARGEFTPKLAGRFSVGYTTRKSDGSGSSDEAGLGLRTGLSYAYSPKTSLSLDASKDFQTGADAAGIDSSSLSLGASTGFDSAFGGSASLSYSRLDYLVGSRQDDYLVATVSLTYAVNSYLNFDASYSFNKNDSNTPGVDFTANIFRLGANVRY